MSKPRPAENDVIVSTDTDGYLLSRVTASAAEPITIVYRGTGWNLQYAVARGAKLALETGGGLWYTEDDSKTVEYLETFGRHPSVWRHQAETQTHTL